MMPQFKRKYRRFKMINFQLLLVILVILKHSINIAKEKRLSPFFLQLIALFHVVHFQPALIRFCAFVAWCEWCSRSNWHNLMYCSCSPMHTTVLPYLLASLVSILSVWSSTSFLCYIENSFLHSIQIGTNVKCFSLLNLANKSYHWYDLKLRQFLLKKLSFDFKKAYLIDIIAFSLCIAKMFNAHTFSIFCCVSLGTLQHCFVDLKVFIMMIQNISEGETDKIYDKTTNLRKWKKNRTFVSNHYLHVLYAHGKSNFRHERVKFWVHSCCSRVSRLSRYLVTLYQWNAYINFEMLMVHLQWSGDKRKYDCWKSS